MQAYLSALAAAGQVRVINREVDPRFEVAFVRRLRKILALLLIDILASPGLLAEPGELQEEFNTAYREYQAITARGAHADAVPYAQRAYELGVTLYGRDNKNTAALALNLGSALQRSGQPGKAETSLHEAVLLFEKNYGKDAIELVDPLVELGHAITQTGSTSRHLKYYNRALQIVRNTKGPDSLLFAEISMEIGAQLVFRAQSASGLRYLTNAHAIFMSNLGTDDIRTGQAAFHLGKYHLVAGNLERAELFFLEALHAFEQQDDTASHLQLTAHAFLVELYDRQGRPDRATEHGLAIGRLAPAMSAEDFSPLVRAEPTFPKGAFSAGEKGFVVVEFTVDELGMVRDASVVESEGRPDLKRLALDTIVKYRYAPRFVDDKSVATAGIRHRFDFSEASTKSKNRRLCDLAMSMAGPPRHLQAGRGGRTAGGVSAFPGVYGMVPYECR